MKSWFLKLLSTFDYHSMVEFAQSLAPSHKYRMHIVLMTVSSVWVSLDKVFGLDNTAFLALLIVFVTELVSGITASHIRKEALSSMKLSRFSLKVACYLVLIGVSFAMFNSFKNHGQDLAAIIFDWLHVFLIVQIVFENIISILENLAVISGQDKTAWISKIKNVLNGFGGKA